MKLRINKKGFPNDSAERNETQSTSLSGYSGALCCSSRLILKHTVAHKFVFI